MANIAQPPTSQMAPQPAPPGAMNAPPGAMGTEGADPQTQQGESINLDELTTEQSLNIITQAVRQQPFTYMEHVQLEQARAAVAGVVQPGVAQPA